MAGVGTPWLLSSPAVREAQETPLLFLEEGHGSDREARVRLWAAVAQGDTGSRLTPVCRRASSLRGGFCAICSAAGVAGPSALGQQMAPRCADNWVPEEEVVPAATFCVCLFSEPTCRRG